MSIRHRAPVLVAAVVLAAPIAPAGSQLTCPVRRGGASALITVGGRNFATDSGILRETAVTPYCMGCHDGTVARLITYLPKAAKSDGLLGRHAGSPYFDGDSQHPVDIPYPVGRRGFRPMAEVESLLPLSGGRVTCLSCHAGDDATPADLTISNAGSRLCRTCHEK